MSEEGSFGVSFVERFFGFILLVVGVLALYYTITSASVLQGFTGFFGFLTAIMIILGFVLLTAKTE